MATGLRTVQKRTGRNNVVYVLPCGVPVVLLLMRLCRGPAGWEYSVEAGLGAWVPFERNVHLCRRRRWVRLRVRDKDSKVMEKKKVSIIWSGE